MYARADADSVPIEAVSFYLNKLRVTETCAETNLQGTSPKTQFHC